MARARKLHLDWETYCELDIKKVGAYKYASHPSCEVLMGAFKIGNGKTIHWDAKRKPAMPARLKKALEDPGVIIHAFNAVFERLILKHVLGMDIPIERFRCSMAHAYSLGFAGTLGNVGEQIGIENGKLKSGEDLIKLFCKPQKPTKKQPKIRLTREDLPEEWDGLCGYNIGDVDAEHEVQEFLDQYPMPDGEWELWFLDQRINDRGLPIDIELCHKAVLLADKEKEKIYAKIRRLTGVNNPNSGQQMKAWLHANGCEMPNMQQATVNDWIGRYRKNSKLYKVLELYQMISRSSISKYQKIIDCTDEHSRMRGSLQFSGAQRTKRWAGRLIQPQNFTKPPKGWEPEKSIKLILDEEHPDWAFSHLVTALRGAICSPPGMVMSISDLAGIEGRVLPWLCFFEEKLAKIRAGMDMYLVAASAIYNKPYESLNDDSPERTPGKVAELALGFQGAVGALNQMARNYSLPEYEDQEGLKIVRGWRAANKPIVDFWYAAERAAKNAILKPGTAFPVGRLTYIVQGDFLFCYLPSGGRIAYFQPMLENGAITFMGWDSKVKGWCVIETYGGKLVENATQATAREVLAHGMMVADSRGFLIVGSVHDEILSCQRPLKKYNFKALNAAMTLLPAWADGLPLGAAGYTEQRYKKD